MKGKIILILLFYPIFSFSQIFINGIPFESIINDNYILIYLSRPFCKTKAYYKFPTKCNILTRKKVAITDELGTPIKFNSMTEVISLFEKNGWIFRGQINNYTSSDFINEQFYLLFQKKEHY